MAPILCLAWVGIEADYSKVFDEAFFSQSAQAARMFVGHHLSALDLWSQVLTQNEVHFELGCGAPILQGNFFTGI